MESTVEHVKPVVRPDFATAVPMILVPAGTPAPPFGAPGTGTPLASTAFPSSRMFPEGSTAPEATCAIAASTVADPEFAGFAVETAVTVTVTGAPFGGMMLFEMECGALYRPLAEMVPVIVLPPVVPFTCQVTAVVGCPLIVAENCCWVKISTV